MMQRVPGPLLARSLMALALTAAACAPAGAEDAPSVTGVTGAGLYKTYCASCHGIYGRGDGPVAPSLKVEVPDLTRIAARHGGEFPAEQIRKIIDGRSTRPPHGPRDMPVWGDAFRTGAGESPQADKRANDWVSLLTEYLRSIQRPVG